jgi:hypothetical protein
MFLAAHPQIVTGIQYTARFISNSRVLKTSIEWFSSVKTKLKPLVQNVLSYLKSDGVKLIQRTVSQFKKFMDKGVTFARMIGPYIGIALAGAVVGYSCALLFKKFKDRGYAYIDGLSHRIANFFVRNDEERARRWERNFSITFKGIFEVTGFLIAVAGGAGLGFALGSLVMPAVGGLVGAGIGGAVGGLVYVFKRVF